MTAIKDMVADRLLYTAADILGVTLYQVAGVYRGVDNRKVQVGPWALPIESTICSDELGKDMVSLMYRIHGDAWAYLVVEDHVVLLYVFDGAEVGLKVKDIPAFLTGQTDMTLAKIQLAVKKEYIYDSANNWWSTSLTVDERQRQAGEDAVSSGADDPWAS
jgi:hypothetical protein